MKLKLCLLLIFVITHSWSQAGSTKTFIGNGTFPVPAGVTSIIVQAWGGGGSGGGASGAPLLLGRGAAGGGGGAYASAPLLVTPGTTLNVVVASQTTGTTGAGVAGGNSTITGFESSILAAGGSGGDANNAGGSPAGGVGGTTAASAGTTKFAGANGGNGNSWNLLGLLLSSGAGGAGANSGGAGGTAVSGLILSNGPGNAGSPPGGAGSGAINSALGASQIGGAGAAGRVVISYSCANFSLTSTAATGVCASAGTTSTVTLTGSAASLPIGNYVVTYNRSSPSATALTANLTVSTAGTGTFTAVGLTIAGSSTITITKLESESCSSTITTNNTATITVSPASVGGTVSGGTTICSGSTSGVLTLSGNTGTVVKWQSSVSPFTTWTDIANTNTTYTSGALTATTQFRTVVQSGACAAVNSAATTVSVSPATVAGTVSGGASICSGSTSGLLTLSGNTELVVKWQSSVSPFSTWTDIANTNTTYTSGALTETTQFRAVVQSGVCAATNSDPTTVTVSPTSVGGTVSGGTAINPGDTSGLLTLSGHTGSVIKWQSSVSPFSTWTDIANTNTTYTSGSLTETTQFRAVVQSGSCAVANSAATTVTVNPMPTITLVSSSISNCSTNDGSASGTILPYTATTESPTTYSVVWNSSPANSFVTVTDAALPANSIPIAIPAGVVPGTYTGTLTVKNANGAVSSPATIFTVTINETPLITTTGTIASVCTSTNAQNTTLAYSGVTGSPISYFINWNGAANAASLADQGVTSFAFAPGGGIINTIQVSANAQPGTYYGQMYISTEICNQLQQVSITILPAAVGGTVSGGSTICSGGISDWLMLSDYTGTIVKWQSSISPFTVWTDIAYTDPTYISGALTETTQFRAVVQNGICDAVNSTATTVTVGPLPTIALSASAQSVCISPSPQNTTLSYSGTTGSPTTYSIVWSSSPENSFEAVSNAALSGSNITILVPAETAIGTYTGTLTVKNADGCVSSGSAFTVTIDDIPSIGTFGVLNSVCTSTNAQTASLEYNFTSGNPTSYAINWDSAANAALLADQPNTPFVFQESGSLNTIVIPANVPGGIYHGTLILSNAGCSESKIIILTVSPTTVGGTVNGGTTVCSGNPSGELTLSGYTGSIINWQSSVSPFTTWTDIENTEITYTSDVLTETTQFRAVIQSGGCDVENSEATTVTVSPLPTLALDLHGSPNSSFCRLDNQQDIGIGYQSDQLTGSPVTYSIVWNSSPPNNFGAVIDAPIQSFFSYSIPGGVDLGTYTGTITVKNEFGCESSGSVFNVTIVAPPSITTSGVITTVCTSTNAQVTSLTYNSSIGNPTTYYIDWDETANNALLEDQGGALTFEENGGIINGIEVPANVPGGTYNGILYLENNSCDGSYPVSITISPATVGGAVTGGTTIGSGSTSGLLTLSGHTGDVVKWQYVSSPFFAWQDLPVTTTTYTSGPLTETTQFRALVQSGTCDAEYSDLTIVIVEDLPTIALASSTENRCYIEDFAQATTLEYTETTGEPVTYSIVWDASPANSFVPVIDATLQASPITIGIPGGTDPGIYTGTLTVKDSNGVSSSGSIFSVNMAEIPSITLTQPSYNVCQNYDDDYNLGLLYSGTTGGVATYSIVWPGLSGTFVPITDAVLDPDSVKVKILFSAPSGTYEGILTVKNENGCVSQNYNFSVTINESPAAPIITQVKQPTTDFPTGDVFLSGLPSVGNWSITTDPATETVTGSGETKVITGIAPGTYVFKVTLDEGCASTASDTVVVNYPLFPRGVPSKDTSTTGTDLKSLKNPITVSALNKVINVETPNQIIDKVYIFDVSGNLIYEKVGVSDPKLVITDLRSSNQVLVVKVILNNGKSETRKVIF